MPLTNSQYNMIISKYDAKRLANAAELESRRDYVYKNVDGYKEICDAVASLTLERTRLALKGDKSALEDLGSMIDDFHSQKEALLLSASLPADYLESKYECPDCQDTGYIDNAKCHCFKQEMLALLYDQSNIKDVLNSVDFNMISDKYYSGEDLNHFRDSYRKSINFIQTFDKDYQNLIFYGTVGTGKSLMSACIAKELINTGHSVTYFSAAALMDAISQDTFGNKNREKTLTNNLYDCDLLIIDDLGTEMVNSFTISSLFSLLNERSIRKKSVIISTNLTLEQLRDTYSDRTFSRLTGNYSFCRMSGPDIRIISKFNN